MSNDYVTTLLVNQRMADLQQEAAQRRLARLTRAGLPRRRPWWEPLMLFRTRGRRAAAARGPAAATVAAGDSPC